ncbi:MAG TPA: lipid-A-disaccharide synthase-related protein [Limnochordales bacterium]
MNVLLVTNGHGEDRLALCLAGALTERRPALRLRALPLVGEGRLLAEAGLAVAGPRVHVPSGGLVRPTWDAVWRDLRAGLIGQFRRQMGFLRAQASWVDWAIAVGDTFAGWVTGRCLPGRPLILVATAKSAYIHGHSRLEALWMRRRCRRVFTRDEPTAAELRRFGVPAAWQGNLMMDALDVTGQTPVAPGEGPVVALLPGSRTDAYVNLGSLAHCLERLALTLPRKAGGTQLVGLVPLAPGLRMDRAAAVLLEKGWTPMPAQLPAALGFRDFGKQGARLRLTRGVFGDVLCAADVVIGLAGTANEQAAGLGKPVVAFPGPGVQFGPRFLRAQKRLLGDALAVVPPDPHAVAAEAAAILQDESRRAHMGAVGRGRMGPPGAARRMAADIVRLWEDDSGL